MKFELLKRTGADALGFNRQMNLADAEPNCNCGECCTCQSNRQGPI